MHLLSCLLVILLMQETASAQQPKRFKKPETREEFLSLSRSQRTAGWILLGAGVVSIAAVSPGNASFGTTGTVAILGSAAILSSVPLFIAARRNKKKGLAKTATIHFNNTQEVARYIQHPNVFAVSIRLAN